MLYLDPQAQICAGFCSLCGGALYFPSKICLRCQEDAV